MHSAETISGIRGRRETLPAPWTQPQIAVHPVPVQHYSIPSAVAASDSALSTLSFFFLFFCSCYSPWVYVWSVSIATHFYPSLRVPAFPSLSVTLSHPRSFYSSVHPLTTTTLSNPSQMETRKPELTPRSALGPTCRDEGTSHRHSAMKMD